MPDGLIKASGIGIAIIVVPGIVFGFPSAVLTVGGIVFTTGVVFGLGRAG